MSQPRMASHPAPACRYGMGKTIVAEFATVTNRLQSLLNERGFQLLFNVDLATQLYQESGVRYPRYHILGANHAQLIGRALAAEPQIGLLFPCHLIQYEDHQGHSVVMARDPARVMDLLRHPLAIEAAMQIRTELEAVIDAL